MFFLRFIWDFLNKEIGLKLMVKVSGVIVCRKKIWNGYVVLFAEEKPVIGLEKILF